MESLYSKQAVISLIGLVGCGLLYSWFSSGFFLVLGLLFLGSYLQCIYDMYKEKRSAQDTTETKSENS